MRRWAVGVGAWSLTDGPVLRFRARIELRGVNPYILVSPSRARRLRATWRRPMPVRIQVNGEPSPPWRVNMMPAGNGAFYLYLNGIVRQASGTIVGDTIDVAVEFDAAYVGGPTHPMPAAFSRGLRRDPTARHRWRALTPSLQKEILRYLAALRSPDARDRNVAKALHVLGGGGGRFLGRDWNGSRSTESAPNRRRTVSAGRTDG